LRAFCEDTLGAAKILALCKAKERSEVFRMNELREIEERNAETSELIEHRREEIEKLEFDGLDTTSPLIVFDSLCTSHFLKL
jgi:hypothetical protein